jgi:hypothetical protein
MPDTRFDWLIALLGVAFIATFAYVVVPPFIDDNLDLASAVQDAFVNPYASGFAIDAIFTYAVLVVWIVHESVYREIRHGWLAIVLGLVAGVAVGLVVYLLIRHREIGPQTWR